MAYRAQGVVTRAELLNAGVTSDEIVHRVRTGSLIAVFRGVYRVGHRAPSVEARYMAAVKAAGEGDGVAGRSGDDGAGDAVARDLLTLALLSFDELARAAHEATVRYGVTEVEKAPQRLRAILEGDAPILLSRA